MLNASYRKRLEMKKMFAVGATAALMLAASSPAFAQATAINEGDSVEGDSVEFNAVAQNISGGFGDITQSQFGQADAVSGDVSADADDDSVATADSSAVADVAQEQDFTFVQFNSVLNDF